MVAAPVTSSSAGWNTATTVPDHAARVAASSAAAPSRQVTWTSWPQAWATPSIRLAYGSPVVSCTGRASMSARNSTVGPSPLRSTPTTPVVAIPVSTS